MKVIPKLDYVTAGYPRIKLDSKKIYNAEIAYNQPEYEEKGKIFVNGMLLENGEYKIVGNV